MYMDRICDITYTITIHTNMHTYPKEFLLLTAETWHQGSPERAPGEVPLSHHLREESEETDYQK